MGTVADGKAVYERRRFRTGPGEVVPRAYERARAREAFWEAVTRVAPDAIPDLQVGLIANLLLVTQAIRHPNADRPDWMVPPVPLVVTAEYRQLVIDEGLQLMDALDHWRKRFHLDEPWCAGAAFTTALLREWGFPWPLFLSYDKQVGTERAIFSGWDDLLADLYEGKYDSGNPAWFPQLTDVPEHLERFPNIWLDQLKLPDAIDPNMPDGVWHDVGWLGIFDPRGETIEKAVERLMPELERRLRRALTQMKADDTAGDTVPVRSLPPEHHFDWTVRYQVLGETYSHIARTAGTDHKNVSKSVKKVADIIGLTLREPDEGGRPAKRARCVKLTRKPGTS